MVILSKKALIPMLVVIGSLFVSGCDPSRVINELRDDRATEVFGIINGSAGSRFGELKGEYCKAHMSAKLPPGLTVEYDVKGCKITYKDPNSKEDEPVLVEIIDAGE